MPRRLASKLIVSLTIIVVIVGSISGFINVKTQEQQLLDALIQGADQLSSSISRATWHAMLGNHRDSAYEVMQTIARGKGIERIRIFNREGRVMFSTIAKETGTQVDKQTEACAMCHASPLPRTRVDAAARTRIFRTGSGRRLLATVTPIYNEAACSRVACHAHPADQKVLGLLDLAQNLDSVDQQMADMKLHVAEVTAIQIVLISLLIILFTRHFVSVPIRRLIEGAQAVSAMELDRSIELPSTSEELDHLANSFDMMRERLRQALGEINDFTQKLEAKVEERTQQLKNAQQKLVQADRLASLGQLAATVAHEINNPVSGVLNLAMLMQRILKDDGIPPERIPEFRKYLTQVVNETGRVGRIVSGLLAFSRRSKPQRSQADLNKIIRATLTLIDHKLRLSNVTVATDLPTNLPPVACDPSQMQQVVLNLLMNAAEATQAKGQGRMEVQTRLDSKRVVLVVSDDGEGIPPENMTKIFDPFFTTKGEGKGVGLGLAVLYGIVDGHGGEVEVNSKVGQGATFTVSLPLAAAESRRAAGAAAGSGG